MEKEKPDVSLDSLAQMFSPQLGQVFLSEEELLKNNIVTQQTLIMHKNIYGEIKTFSFEKILYISLLEKSLVSGNVSLCFLVTLPNEFYIEKAAKIILRLNISQCIEELKIKI